MSPSSDFLSEMPNDPSYDDAVPAAFAEEVRFAVSGPPPVPSAALAAVMVAGISTAVHPADKGDLLVTAASNVNGPAPQVAGLPKWREEKSMGASGVLAGLLAKVSGVGTAAKATVAGIAAVATMGVAGAAAGVLPGPAQNAVATAVNAATPFQFPGTDAVNGAVEHATGQIPKVDVPKVVPPSVPSVSVDVGAKAGSTSAGAGAKVAPSATPAVPNVGVPSLPPVAVPPAVGGLIKNLPACVTNLVPTGGGVPDPAKLATQIPACIPQVLAAAGLPVDVAKCIASVLGSIGGASGMTTGSVPSIGSLKLSSCVPVDATKCVSSMLGLLANLPGVSGGFPGFAGAIPGFGSIPGLSNVAGCVPMNVSACINSITSAVGALPTTGGVPTPGSLAKLDLSACMPTGATSTGIPGLGTGIPGLGGALPFFGR